MHTSCYILIFSGRGSNWIHTLDHLGVDLQRSLRNELEALDLEAQWMTVAMSLLGNVATVSDSGRPC